MRLDDGFQALESCDARLRIAMRGIAYNGSEDRHSAAIDVDEGLRDNESDNLRLVRSCTLCLVAPTLVLTLLIRSSVT